MPFLHYTHHCNSDVIIAIIGNCNNRYNNCNNRYPKLLIKCSLFNGYLNATKYPMKEVVILPSILLKMNLNPDCIDFSGEGEILQISRDGRNNAYFRKPEVPGSSPNLASKGLQQVHGINITALRPRFSSRGTTYRVKIGETVTMSCEIINLGKSLG